ncbi:hypothetical protein PUR61_19350, partial [Streptomyces sp. BE20]|uniref:hypothetical protein n=1 Tax=Streptomyces sp. BE20 TaxID=3002525 RepID=UPI002E7A0DA0
TGIPVAEVDALRLRPVTAGQLARGAADRVLFGVEWAAQEGAGVVRGALLRLGDELPVPGPVLLVDASGAGAAGDRAAALLVLLQAWLSDAGWSDSRLVVRTLGAAG